MLTSLRQWTVMVLLSSVMLSTMGCTRYLQNRYHDMRDLGHLAVGVTSENSLTGMVPPSLGVYFEATDFLHLGAIAHHGYTAEFDMRGSGIYKEDRTRLGFLWWQAFHQNQDYEGGLYTNYFKTPGNLWDEWMNNPVTYFHGLDAPAKSLIYDHWNDDLQYGTALLHRGYQYWEYVGGEMALSDPFLTHLGLTLRAGFDISEVSDFILGWFLLDYKKDDLSPAMFDELRGHSGVKEAGGRAAGPSGEAGEPPVAGQETPDEYTTIAIEPADSEGSLPDGAAVTNGDLDALRDENTRLSKSNKKLGDDLAQLQARVKQLEGGVEINLPDRVLFKSGLAELTPAGKSTLDELAKKLRTHYPSHRILVEGHTDNIPVDRTQKIWPSNWELGSARSLSVLHYLTNDAGLNQESFGAVTYGSHRPETTNTTENGRQKNRRAQISVRPIAP